MASLSAASAAAASDTAMTAPSAGVSQGQAIVNAAASQVGVPYCADGGDTAGPTHGAGGSGCGGSTVGFDCSGLALYAVYQATGIVLPHGSGMQAVNGGQVILDQSDLQPRDLVFFGGGSLANFEHVGIYAGGGEMWDANDFNVPVQEHSLTWEETGPDGLAFDGGVRYWSGGGSGGTKPGAGPSIAINPATGLAYAVTEGPNNSLYAYWENSNGQWTGPLGIDGGKAGIAY